MKKWWLFACTLIGASSMMAQEIFLADVSIIGDNVLVEKLRNISNNPGYDNQPCFTKNDKAILFASTRNGQTDIVKFHLDDSTKHWFTQTAGSEYSPVEMPDTNSLSAVKLDKNGYQRLWKFSKTLDDSSLIHPGLKIGYYLWLDAKRLACFVLDSDSSNSLNLLDLETNKLTLICSKPGRCLQKIPDSDAFSFVDKTDSAKWVIKSYDLKSGVAKKVANTLDGSEDYCWTPAGNLIMASGAKVYWLNLMISSGWVPAVDFYTAGIRQITRLAINSAGTRVAFVAAE